MASIRLLNPLQASLNVSTSRSLMRDPDEPAEGTAERAPLPASGAKLGDQIRPAVLSVLVLTLLTGCVFPLLLAAIGRPLFPRQASGSLLTRGGAVIGSELIGQEFSRPEYFQSRPSAAGNGYDGMSSGGSNLGPQQSKAEGRRSRIRRHPATRRGIPQAQRSRARHPDSHRRRDALGERTRSRYLSCQCGASDSPRGACAASVKRPSAAWLRNTPRGGSSGSWATRGRQSSN